MPGPPPPPDVERGVAALAAGGLVAFPTETVYGLGADASDAEAVGRVFAVKGRPADHPVIVHLGSADGLDRWAATVGDEARALAAALWPGPLTLVLRRASHVLDVVTGGLDTVGLRVPDQPTATALLVGFGGGVAAPSANRFGSVSPTTAADVVAELGPFLDPERDLVLDGGPCRVGVESTIVDCSVGEARVLRPGGVTVEQLAGVLGRPVRRAGEREGPRASGRLESHYAPRARVELVVDGAAAAARATELAGRGARVGVLGAAAPAGVVALGPADDAAVLAHVLYSRLREADRRGLDVVVAVEPLPSGLGEAVADRLRRAAGPRRGSGEAPPG